MYALFAASGNEQIDPYLCEGLLFFHDRIHRRGQGINFMKTPKMTIILLACLAMLVSLVTTLAFWSFSQIEAAAEARKHSGIIYRDANNLLSALTDAETGERGYLLTGDEAFLQPYLLVRDRVGDYLKELRRHTLIGSARIHLDAMAPLVDAKLVEMSDVIKLRRNHEMTELLAEVSNGRGKRLMDAIRAEMDSFLKIEESALALHEAEFQAKMRLLFIVIVIASLLTLLLALSFAILFNRQKRQQVINLVHQETEHLLKIQEETNRQLQQVNATVLESKEELVVTLNSIGDGVIATDAEARVTRLNPIAEQLTGWTQAEAIDRKVEEIFHIINKNTRQPTAIPIMEAIVHGVIQGLSNHTVLIARDGRECDIADSCAPIINHNGQAVGAVLVFRNVTKEYAAQQSLRDSAVLIQTILDTVVDGIITIHGQSGIIETMNRAAAQMFNYTAEELTGHNLT